jgi:hypothetical protein
VLERNIVSKHPARTHMVSTKRKDLKVSKGGDNGLGYLIVG